MDLLSIAVLLLVFSVYAAPSALDPQTLLQNAHSAQGLNAEFERLSRNDSCISGQLACITGSVAICQKGAWRLQRCLDQRRCFALPSVRTNGTFVDCTSEASALSIIKACGGIGGLASNTNLTVLFPTVNDTSMATTPECSSTFTTNMSSTIYPENPVTITFTLGQGQSVALPPTTETLKPDQASSLISSLLANGGSVVTTTTSPPASSLMGDVRGANFVNRATLLNLTPMPSATSGGNMTDV